MVQHADIDHTGLTGVGGSVSLVAQKIVRTSADYTTTSATLVDVDTANLTITLTTGARRCLVGLTGTGTNSSASGRMDVAFEIDGAVPNGAFMLISQHSEVANPMNISMVFLTDVLTAASHDFVLQFARGSAGTGTLFASTTQPLCFYVVETLLTS